ncbi:LacI family DNA-binding transcriptional regulator [Terrilactibacillus laevilacticus]|uniref:LacI family DNA-binding transcriptional regulator n=1 Tax=Terrilactibacillus laevilacticus TaxID=1380157 RepID=A0ABW5PUP9_9BACI|nr:LacI family DNA-binding transcriptional regulator [Terrilactibacillus laevilacticus]
MVTLSDVAKKAVVSKMTVSRVINHPDKVSPELRELVYKAMKDLNYVPNFTARALVQKRTQVIKLLILEEMDTTEPYYMNLLTGIAVGLDKYHYALQLVTRNSHEIGPCDGVIATGMRIEDYENIIEQLEPPVVLFGHNDKGYDFVDVDNEKGIQMATQHVIDLGYNEILFFGIDLDEPFMQTRIKGYQKMIEKHNLNSHLFMMKNSSHVSQAKATKQLEKDEERIAFVCASDRLAIGVVRAAQALGLLIPQQVAITGFDGVFLDQISSPKLTTVRQPVMEMGEALADMLLQKIDLDGERLGNRIFQPELIIRESTIK